MMEIVNEDECNDTYGHMRMYQTLQLKHKDDDLNVPGERTIYRIMKEIGLAHNPRRKPNGITQANKLARKSEDLFKRDFTAEEPNQKAVTDISEVKASDGKLYVSAIFDCYDLLVLGLCIEDNMKAELYVNTINNAVQMHPEIRGIMCHSDRGSQYSSELYRATLNENQIVLEYLYCIILNLQFVSFTLCYFNFHISCISSDLTISFILNAERMLSEIMNIDLLNKKP